MRSMSVRLSLAVVVLVGGCAPGSGDEPSVRADETRVRVAPVAPVPAAPPTGPTDFVEMKATKAPGVLPGVTAKSPTKNQVIATDKSAAQVVKFDLRSWKIAPGGNAVHVILDNQRVRKVTDIKKTLTLGDFTDGKPLSEGAHLLAILPVYATGESVKPAQKRSPAAIVPFYVGKKTDDGPKDGAPLLILNTPVSGQADGAMLDFYVVNAELARGRFVVHAAVAGPELSRGESIHQWRPWRIANARAGEHTVKVELFEFVADSFESGSAVAVNKVSKPVPGLWATATRDVILDR